MNESVRTITERSLGLVGARKYPDTCQGWSGQEDAQKLIKGGRGNKMLESSPKQENAWKLSKAVR